MHASSARWQQGYQRDPVIAYFTYTATLSLIDPITIPPHVATNNPYKLPNKDILSEPILI